MGRIGNAGNIATEVEELAGGKIDRKRTPSRPRKRIGFYSIKTMLDN
jgi:hypothetical protein